jgi:AbrB family looped-hinge helix DNA binding protein
MESMEQTAETEVRERGEITIPKKIREAFHLEPGQKVEFIPIGTSALLLTPKRLDLQDARRQIQRILRQAKADPKKVLEGLKESREETFRKHYGKKHGR